MGHTLQLGDAQVDENKLADLCRHYGVRELSLFGSAVRGEMQPGSDIDVMVEFDPHVRIGLLKFESLSEDLEALLGRKVDLVTKRGLKSWIRPHVFKEARVVFIGVDLTPFHTEAGLGPAWASTFSPVQRLVRCGSGRMLGMKYRVYLEPDEDGVFVATCPALPGCVSQGRTRVEATENIREAIEGYLKSLRKHGDPLPPSIIEEIVEVARG